MPTVDISGSRALWLAARGHHCSLLGDYGGWQLKETQLIWERLEAFHSLPGHHWPFEPTELEDEAERRDNAYVAQRSPANVTT